MKRKAAFKIVFIYAVFMLFFCMFSEGESVYAADFETADIKEKYEQNTVNLRKNVFRLYNRKTGEYLYTSDIEENNKIAEDSEWMSEGIVWSFDEGKGTPVYRLYSEKKGHRYTESFDECIWMKENGWKYEGVCWCIDSQSEGTFHTMINPYAESERDKYVYTQSSAEIDMLTRLGWTNLPGVYYIEIQEDRDTYNSRTVDYYLGGKGSVVKYLNSNKSKFLGIDYDDNNEVYYYNFDAPKEKMQCAQFVSIVMNNCGCNLNKLTSESGGDPSQASAWIYFAKNHKEIGDVEVYEYDSVNELLDDGIAKKGDIIIFESLGEVGFKDEFGNMYDNHIGIFWGDESNYDKMWHSAGMTSGKDELGNRIVYEGSSLGNQISNVTPVSASNRIYLLPVSRY